MKTLPLSKEQELKILEMCKALFPVFKWFKIWNEKICLSEQHRDDDSDESHEFLNSIISIHWFEFCITWLVEKIILTSQYHGCKEEAKVFMWECLMHHWYNNNLPEYDNPDYPKHPVDYLYEEYKKIATK